MTAPKGVDPAGFLREQVDSASPDLLRAMVKTFADALMSAEADAACGAPYGQRSDERTNQRNGYRMREWDTRAGTVELAVPKLRRPPTGPGAGARRRPTRCRPGTPGCWPVPRVAPTGRGRPGPPTAHGGRPARRG